MSIRITNTMFLSMIGLIVISKSIGADEFIVRNCVPGPIQVGIQGNPGHPHLNNGGFVLNQNEERTVASPENWQGRFWAKTYCVNRCATGDCGNRVECQGAGGEPPASLIEISKKVSGGLDFYDLSLVDGFNVPVSIAPVGGSGDGGQYSCRKASCNARINEECPNELRLLYQGVTIACKSACVAFNNDPFCCRGYYNSAQTCQASGYANFFKVRCPDAYSYAYDDRKSLFTCRASTYRVEFGC